MHSDWGIADQRVAGRPPVGWLIWSIAPNDMSYWSAASMRLLLTWPWKRALIWVLDNPLVDALMASRIRSAVWSPVDVPKKREALAEQ
jgi:hypothetical protein